MPYDGFYTLKRNLFENGSGNLHFEVLSSVQALLPSYAEGVAAGGH